MVFLIYRYALVAAASAETERARREEETSKVGFGSLRRTPWTERNVDGALRAAASAEGHLVHAPRAVVVVPVS